MTWSTCCPRQPDGIACACHTAGYLALAAGHAVAAAVLAAAAPALVGVLAFAHPHVHEAAAVAGLGCLAGCLLRSAGLCWFLKVTYRSCLLCKPAGA